MSYNTKLGICIPTYKRPDQLHRCVDSIIASAAPFAVPIFIADDSTDETNTETIAALQSRYPHIIYEKNARNLGIDRNILHCANICPCEYAWLMGEDDRMTPEGVATVLPILERDAPAFLAVNYSYVDENIAVVLQEKQLDMEEDRTEDSDTFFRKDAWAVGFIGSCVVNKRLWQAVDPELYIGTYFAHVGVILACVAGKSVSLVARPLVLNRVGGADVFTWSGDAYGVFHGWAKVARLLEPLYSADAALESAESFERHHGLNTLRFLMAKRADRVYDLRIYYQFIQKSARSHPHKWAALGIALSHPLPFRGLRSVLNFVRARRNRKLPVEAWPS